MISICQQRLAIFDKTNLFSLLLLFQFVIYLYRTLSYTSSIEIRNKRTIICSNVTIIIMWVCFKIPINFLLNITFDLFKLLFHSFSVGIILSTHCCKSVFQISLVCHHIGNTSRSGLTSQTFITFFLFVFVHHLLYDWGILHLFLRFCPIVLFYFIVWSKYSIFLKRTFICIRLLLCNRPYNIIYIFLCLRLFWFYNQRIYRFILFGLFVFLYKFISFLSFFSFLQRFLSLFFELTQALLFKSFLAFLISQPLLVFFVTPHITRDSS